jgi:ribosomal protein S18 acetylase RimI-like enzyme
MGASLEGSEPVRGATWDDFDNIVELLARQNRAATGIAVVRPEFVRAEWELPSFEVGLDNWVSGTSGYAALSPSGDLTLAAATDAEAAALLDSGIARARERELEKLTLRPRPSDEVIARLLERRGFRLQTDLLAMWRRLSATAEAPPDWPGGITARTFEPADAAAVHALLDEAYGGWDTTYVPLAHEDWVRSTTGDVEFDATTWWLAERGSVLAGCALWWSSGWLKDIVVRDSERGRGLGAALIRQGFVEFARRDVRRVGLKVDARNPTGAPRLYERLGFTTEGREQIWALSL